MNILVVEDDTATSDLLMRNLRRWNHHVETSETGRDALKKVQSGTFDLILLDIFLPDGPGHKLIPQFKEEQHDIGIVAVTGHNSRELEFEVRKEGVIFYMLKPLSIKTLKELIDHMSKKKIKEVLET